MTASAGTPPEAVDVFLHGCGLPQRWRGRERFVVLETGFGTGHNFLATWQAWRADPQRCSSLVFIAIEPRPLHLPSPIGADLKAAQPDAPHGALADALLEAWPALTPNLHRLSFDAGQVQLLLMVAELQQGLAELVAHVDAFFLAGLEPGADAAASAGKVCKAIGRLAAPGASLAATNATPTWMASLTTAGFAVRSAADGGPGSDAGITLATFAPRFTPQRAPTRTNGSQPTSKGRRALIVGAGLAGCATAWALAEQGWHTTVLERGAAIAQESSGNPAGLFHGIVNAQDGRHARFNRAAALEARAAVQIAVDHHGVGGAARGLLRLESQLQVAAMRATLAHLGLPPGYVQAVDAEDASRLADMALSQPAWFYPGGGWVHPGGLARAFLERAGAKCTQRTGIEVHALNRSATGWRLLDAHGALIDEADVVVLANAGDALRLLVDAALPMERVRGQISVANASALVLAQMPEVLPLPQLPITGSGYLLPALNGQAVFGATAQPGDTDPSVRPADHAANVAQLERLTGVRLALDVDRIAGRTAWRWVTPDRLPVIGAVPDVQGMSSATLVSRLDQPRFVPRLPGLFVYSALGSRGITWSALGAQTLAALISGAPVPLEASLLDAVDPARFAARRTRHAQHRSRG
jgi:tRNA 5-methylaminomethyl-2-thiouridine biosynthesis bifunctional protein